MKKRVVAILALTLLLTVTVSVTSPAFAASSEQVVFSGLASTTQTPVGFWIWCEGQSGNPYQGKCNGAMYFYAFHITKGVAGSANGTSTEQFTMSVQSSDGTVMCTLVNVSPLPPSSGPTNTVTVSCSAPSVSGSSTNAVVEVTSS